MSTPIFWNALAPEPKRVFDALAQLPVPHDFYLAGGTALALQLGHRISYDLDFFSTINLLDLEERESLSRLLQHLQPVTIKRESEGQLYATIMGIEVSFVHQHHALLFPTVYLGGIQAARPADIGLMKLSAIKDRGSRRDFIDLYALRKLAPLRTLFQLLPLKYSDRPEFTVHLAYALRYFDDAEADPRELSLLQKISWGAVKKYCTEGARLLSKLNAGLEPPE